MVDDKSVLLAAMRRKLGGKLTTVFVRQGHYGVASVESAIDPEPDVGIAQNGDLRDCVSTDFSAKPGMLT